MTDNGTFRDMVEDLQHELNEINSKLRSLAFDLKIEREVHEKTWAQKEKLERQNEALRDVVRAAQLLVDLKHVTGNLTDETFANLTAALRSWYEPNGGGRD
jgi:predicted  nucleic acid-binding Zn-ribbon protein